MQRTLQLLDCNDVSARKSKECVYVYSFIAVAQNTLQHQATCDQELPEQEVIFFI